MLNIIIVNLEEKIKLKNKLLTLTSRKDKIMGNYHTDKKCKNCVLNGDCLEENPEDCDEKEDDED